MNSHLTEVTGEFMRSYLQPRNPDPLAIDSNFIGMVKLSNSYS